MTFTPIFVVVRASTATAERCAGSLILTNTNAACECLLDARRCFVVRRDLLFVVRSLRGAAGALLQGWSLEAPAPKTAHRLASQRCFANCEAFHAAISFAPARAKYSACFAEGQAKPNKKYM